MIRPLLGGLLTLGREQILGSMVVQSGSTPLLEYAAGTTVGSCRTANEDTFGLFTEDHTFVVADGCGGHSSGWSAASLAVAGFKNHLALGHDLAREFSLPAADPLALAVLKANADIFRAGQAQPELQGQGAALCAVRVSSRMMSAVHVGDCRVGLYRQERLIWLTEDHSLSAELRKGGASPKEIASADTNHSNVITRAIGITEELAVELSYHPSSPGATYLLCTDGLTRQVNQARISKLLDGRGQSLSALCAALLKASEEAGGHDNTTVVLLRLRS